MKQHQILYLGWTIVGLLTLGATVGNINLCSNTIVVAGIIMLVINTIVLLFEEGRKQVAFSVSKVHWSMYIADYAIHATAITLLWMYDRKAAAIVLLTLELASVMFIIKYKIRKGN